mgnify:CR=1 FL=1
MAFLAGPQISESENVALPDAEARVLASAPPNAADRERLLGPDTATSSSGTAGVVCSARRAQEASA